MTIVAVFTVPAWQCVLIEPDDGSDDDAECGMVISEHDRKFANDAFRAHLHHVHDIPISLLPEDSSGFVGFGVATAELRCQRTRWV